MVVVEPEAEAIKGAGTLKKKADLTTPDLVLLSLLAERPMHGYQANAELERRQIRDWAPISRPQIYYSMEKLARAQLIRAADTTEPAAGPERASYETTVKGRAALAEALGREAWATQRDKPEFLTWLGLSWQARPETVRAQLARREAFLKREIARERETLESVLREVGHSYHEAVWMVSLTIEKLEVELRWLKRVAANVRRRGKAKHPDYAR